MFANATLKDMMIVRQARKAGFAVSIGRNRVGLTGLRNAADYGQLDESTMVIETGPATSRTTATRVATGAVLGLGVGAIVGAIAKKNTTKVHATVTTPDGKVYIAEHSASDMPKLQRIANDYNARFSQSDG